MYNCIVGSVAEPRMCSMAEPTAGNIRKLAVRIRANGKLPRTSGAGCGSAAGVGGGLAARVRLAEVATL